jgi:hypothetical protein
MNDPSLCIHAVSKPSVLSPISQSPKPFFARLVVAFVSLISLASATPASAQATNFGSVNVCPLGKTTPAPCSANQTITFSIPAETTISSIAIVATGIPDLDFKAEADDSSATLCKAQKYSTAATCTVDVTFTPLAAGARRGAVELLNGSGAVISTTYITALALRLSSPSIPPPSSRSRPHFRWAASSTPSMPPTIFTS